VVSIPNGVNVQVSGKKVSVKGPKGSVERLFNVKGLVMKVDGGNVLVEKDPKSKLDVAIVGSVTSHIANMITGVTKGYEKKMQAIYAHFPVSMEVKGDKFIIKNFIGEKKNREARISGSTKIAVKGQEIVISGLNKEDVGQTVANIRAAVKIRNRDPRIFQDGLYVVEG